MDVVQSFANRLGRTVIVVVVAAAMLAGLVAWLLSAQRDALVSRLDAELASRASDIEFSLAGGLDATTVADPRNEARFVQIVDIINEVVASSPNLSTDDPVATWEEGTRTLDVEPLRGTYRVVTIETTRTAEPLTVHVGGEFEFVNESIDELWTAAARAGVVFLAILGIAVWIALRPSKEPTPPT